MSLISTMLRQLRGRTVPKVEPAPAPPVLTEVSDSLIGQLLVESGSISQEAIPRILEFQREDRLRFGEAALRLGLVDEPAVERALARQFDFPMLRSGDLSLSQELVAAYEPMGAHAEALRGIRAQLMLQWFKAKSRSLAVIGPRAGAGTSQLAANLAITFAQLGENTLLIDANFRDPRQHRLFGLGDESGPGLSNVLANRGAAKELIRKIEPFANLSLLCAGSPPPNPQELLGRLSFAYVVETVPAAYTVVIIDTPPALDYADAQLIAAHAGACMLVTHRNETRINDIKRTQIQLKATGAAVLGAVMCG